jgi:hypothetical protein
MTCRFMERATVRRLVNLNGRRSILPNREVSILHNTHKRSEAQIMLCTQEQSFGIDRVCRGFLSSEVRTENIDPLA